VASKDIICDYSQSCVAVEVWISELKNRVSILLWNYMCLYYHEKGACHLINLSLQRYTAKNKMPS